MADKEATVYVVDVGKSMGEIHGGRNESDLEWAMRYVWDRITTTVASGRKTWVGGVVGLRTDESQNPQSESGEEGYENISIFKPISQLTMDSVRDLHKAIKPSDTDEGDAFSALAIAVDMIVKYCKKLKYTKKIVLVTNGRGEMDSDPEIAKMIQAENIQLTILGVDFDDVEYGFKEEDKSPEKAANEETLRSFVDDCGDESMFGSMAEAIAALSIPRLKKTRPIPSFKGYLTLGDPEKYDTALCIDVERYPKTKVERPPGASSYVVRSDLAAGDASMQSSATLVDADAGDVGNSKDGLAAVKSARTYQIEDEDAPGGKRDVNFEELEKGYEYGRTAVHISATESNIVDLETFAGLDIIGFVPREKFERYLAMSSGNQIVAQKANEKAGIALSSFIHALYELDSYAVARLVIKEGKKPLIILLAPSIEPEYECLVDVELPFAEDMRGYRFPPLDKVVTVSGKTLIQHRNLPSDDLINAMSDYVDAMDLSTFGKDDEGNPSEYMSFEDTFSPVLHRLQQAIRFRAVHPDEEIPPPNPILTKYSQPPEELVKKAQSKLDTLLKVGDIKKVPPKQRGRKRGYESEKPLSGLNIDELLASNKRTRISSENAIPEFKQLLAAPESVDVIRDAVNQLGHIVHQYIKHSIGSSGYGRAVEAIRVMREEMVEVEEPELFNQFIKDLKVKLLKGELDGDRREMWWDIRRNRLGLIDKRISSVSKVDEEEAREFLTAKLT